MQREDEVAFMQCEELRIVDDELFFAVQSRLAELTKGPRGPKKDKQPQLFDLVTDLFWCAHCNVRFQQAGANGRGMRCKNGDLCPCQSIVRRDEATRAICEKLCALINQDAELIQSIICRVHERNSPGDEELQTAVAKLERRIATLSNRISDFYQMAGEGNDKDRKEVMRHVRSTQAERSSVQHELSQRQQQLTQSTATIQPEAVRESLAGFSELLKDAASGMLSEEAVYKAMAVIRRLVGGRVMIHVERRKGRKRKNARGVFTPQLIRAVADQADLTDRHEPAGEEVSVWLREPPRLDAIAERAHELIDIERLSHRDTAKRLQKEGHKVNSGNVWYSYHRWYEMNGQTPPSLPYNSRTTTVTGESRHSSALYFK